jgi:hypothetical protein
MRESISFYLVKDGVKLVRKGDCNTSATAFMLFLYGIVTIVCVIVIIVNHKVPIMHLSCLARFLGLTAAFRARLFNIWLVAGFNSLLRVIRGLLNASGDG